MLFESYSKIPDSARSWNIPESDLVKLQKRPWVVTEKIHGAHFVILTDGKQVKFAKRKEVLSPDDDFFAHSTCTNSLHSKVIALFERLFLTHPTLQQIAVYGELFGGAYPHPNVPPIADFHPIQTGVYYSPHIEFCAFDLALALPTHPKLVMLPYDNAIQHLQAVGIFYAEPLFLGKYADALLFSPIFQSHIPGQLGLPPLRENFAEGIVLKPIHTLSLTPNVPSSHITLKIKHPAFVEDKRFHEAQKWTSTTNTSHPLSFETLRWHAMALITENRLANALSKIGRWDPSNKTLAASLFQTFLKDVWETLEEDPDLSLSQQLPAHSPVRQQLDALIKRETKTLLAQFAKKHPGNSNR